MTLNRSPPQGRRIVFAVLNEEGLPLRPVAGLAPWGFLVIFEYGLVAENLQDLVCKSAAVEIPLRNLMLI